MEILSRVDSDMNDNDSGCCFSYSQRRPTFLFSPSVLLCLDDAIEQLNPLFVLLSFVSSVHTHTRTDGS